MRGVVIVGKLDPVGEEPLCFVHVPGLWLANNDTACVAADLSHLLSGPFTVGLRHPGSFKAEEQPQAPPSFLKSVWSRQAIFCAYDDFIS